MRTRTGTSSTCSSAWTCRCPRSLSHTRARGNLVTDDLSAELAAVRERERKASPGPWKADVEHLRDMDDDPFETLAVVGPDGQMVLTELPDLRFAAHARTDVPRLLAAVDKVLATAEDWEATASGLDRDVTR